MKADFLVTSFWGNLVTLKLYGDSEMIRPGVKTLLNTISTSRDKVYL